MKRIGTLGLLVSLDLACGTLREETPQPVPRIHSASFATPGDPTNHAAVLRASGYDFAPCQSCHGADYGGGSVGVACTSCHPGGPTACTTCHGQPPATGSHVAHTPKIDCGTCHVVPAVWNAPGHFERPAKVTFSGLAVAGGAGPIYTANGTCSGTYCHGGTAVVSGGTLTAPTWGGGPSSVACGTCHAVPPANHYGDACTVCHGDTLDENRNLKNPALHVDGVLEVRDLSQGCASCHGPPQDIGGAHTAHLEGSGLGRPVACEQCHVVPSAIRSPGHLDGIVEIVFGADARAGGASPGWDTVRCNGVYCHGATLPGGSNPAPAWEGGSAEAACGSCHGVPMPNHFGNQCSDCHGAVVDRGFRIIRPDLHINGQVDFGGTP